MTRELSAQLLREQLHYSPETGVFTRLVAVSGRYGAPGRVSGCVDKDGYVRIFIRSRRYMAHRLAWLYVHGFWPANQIDHVNGVKTDNRIVNLRDVPSKTNTQNQTRAHPRSQVKLLGVSRQKQKFRSSIFAGGKSIYLGLFNTPEAAHERYVKAKREMHEGCTL